MAFKGLRGFGSVGTVRVGAGWRVRWMGQSDLMPEDLEGSLEGSTTRYASDTILVSMVPAMLAVCVVRGGHGALTVMAVKGE